MKTAENGARELQNECGAGSCTEEPPPAHIMKKLQTFRKDWAQGAHAAGRCVMINRIAKTNIRR